jgi:Fe2+ or Zn2+ uptake regulation protein
VSPYRQVSMDYDFGDAGPEFVGQHFVCRHCGAASVSTDGVNEDATTIDHHPTCPLYVVKLPMTFQLPYRQVSENYDFGGPGQHFVCRDCKSISVSVDESSERIEHRPGCKLSDSVDKEELILSDKP